MPGPVRNQQILAAEVELLRALCAGTVTGDERTQAMKRLGVYRFRDAGHQLIFDALQEFNREQPQVLRQQLPERLTRKGFPDLDFENFLARTSLSSREVVELVEKLVAGTGSAGQR